jgi:hypothetical protein
MSNRTFTLPGLWALNGQTTIPTPPIRGVTYRNSALSPTDVENGWPFATIVDSSDFNEYLMLASQLLAQMELQGILSWCGGIAYGVGALAFGSDGVLYQCILAGTNKDPTSPPYPSNLYWVPALGVQPLSITTAKLADGAVTAAKATQLLGTWVPKSPNVVYQAPADGWVIAFAVPQAGNSSASAGLSLVSDASAVPSTIRQATSVGNIGQCGVSCPIRKGDYYELLVSSGWGTPTTTMWWIPLGS